MRARGVFSSAGGAAVAATPTHELRVAASALQAVDGIEVKRLPEGLVAALTHTGPYEQIGASYFELLGWMDDRSLKRDGPFMEVYLDGFDGAGPGQANTRILVPVCAPERSCGVSAEGRPAGRNATLRHSTDGGLKRSAAPGPIYDDARTGVAVWAC